MYNFKRMVLYKFSITIEFFFFPRSAIGTDTYILVNRSIDFYKIGLYLFLYFHFFYDILFNKTNRSN